MIQANSSPSEAYEKGVRRPRDRHRRRELGVTHRGQAAGDRGDDEADHDGGTGHVVCGATREGEDAGADHDADAEDGEVEGAEGLLQPELRRVGIGDGLLHRLRAEKAHV